MFSGGRSNSIIISSRYIYFLRHFVPKRPRPIYFPQRAVDPKLCTRRTPLKYCELDGGVQILQTSRRSFPNPQQHIYVLGYKLQSFTFCILIRYKYRHFKQVHSTILQHIVSNASHIIYGLNKGMSSTALYVLQTAAQSLNASRAEKVCELPPQSGRKSFITP